MSKDGSHYRGGKPRQGTIPDRIKYQAKKNFDEHVTAAEVDAAAKETGRSILGAAARILKP